MPARPRRPGARSGLLFLIGVLTIGSYVVLDLELDELVPDRHELGQLTSFAGAALRPALSHLRPVPAGTPSLAAIVLESARLTVVLAATAMSVAVLVGLVLGLLGSTAWWPPSSRRPSTGRNNFVGRALLPGIYAATRLLIALMRSVHELIWALLLLAAVGLSELSAVIAIAIPYAGTLAKVFSESLDEAPRDAARALAATGASPAQVTLFGLLPRALPDMSAYALYRFECAVRSSAILGFFGVPTLGYYIRLEWGMADYREVWTFLYALIALAVLLDLWSGALRKRFVA